MNRKVAVAWAGYDWANSAINTIVFTFVFSVYFAKSVYGDEVSGSAAWSFSQGCAGVFIAALSPLLGAAIDRYGPHKPALKFFTGLCVLLTATLFFIPPEHGYVFVALLVAATLTVFFEFVQNIYNATLLIVAAGPSMGAVSGFGWGFGYLGSIFCLIIALFGFIGLGDHGGFLGISKDNAMHVRATMLFTALWFAVFAIPFFIFCPDKPKAGLSVNQSVHHGWLDLKKLLREARTYPNILQFLLASAIYRDGLATLFAVGGLYAAGTLGMNFSEVMVFAIAINIASGIGAMGFALIDDRIGAKTTVMVSLVALILFGAGVIITDDKTVFIVLACALGLFIGPVQASSRTMLAQLAPPDKTASFFGLYAMTGKAVAFMGPFAFGMLTMVFESQRAGMFSILGFWLLGLLMVYFVKLAKKPYESTYSSQSV